MALNILVVDDSTAIRKILIRVLRQTALAIGEIFEARDGLEALEIVRNHSLNLVLSDINMPNLDGLGLLAGLKGSEQWRELPVAMLTTDASEQETGPPIRSAMGGGGAESFEVAGLPVKNDGNNVSLDRESRLLTENDMRFNLASNLLRSEVQSIRAALQAGRTECPRFKLTSATTRGPSSASTSAPPTV